MYMQRPNKKIGNGLLAQMVDENRLETRFTSCRLPDAVPLSLSPCFLPSTIK